MHYKSTYDTKLLINTNDTSFNNTNTLYRTNLEGINGA